MRGTRYENLEVWQRACDLVEAVYRDSRAFPHEEVFGLTGQMRRATLSVPANIAEGSVRGTSGDYLRFLRIARGSLAELRTYLALTVRLNYLSAERAQQLDNLADKVAGLLYGLIKSIQRSADREAEK